MQQSIAENDITVISIFVNPLQFGPDEDFDAYPRNIEQDSAKAESIGVDYIPNCKGFTKILITVISFSAIDCCIIVK